ncbi:Uncharacterised protein [Mycobacterium tuberculosis]|nr:Uncharacterised protein [Mycobacterium tuberculosis]
MLDQLAAVADHVAGGLDVGGRNQPTPQQTAFQQVHQPLGIQEVGFAARPFFTCPALHTSSSLAVGQQRVISGRTSAHHVLLRLARPAYTGSSWSITVASCLADRHSCIVITSW